MSLGHARPRLTHMPHQIAAREQAQADKIRGLQAGRMIEPRCEVCAAPAAYGFNCFSSAPELGVWACRDHRAEVAQALE